MLSVVGSILVAIVLVVIVYIVWFKSAYSGRSQEDIPEFIRRFIVSTDNGSRLKLHCRKQRLWLGIERKAGSVSNVVAELRIPSNGLSPEDLARLKQEFGDAGRGWRSTDDDLSIVASSEFIISDAWALSSYEELSLASQHILRFLGVEPDEPIGFRTFGKGRVWSPELSE